LKPSPSTLKLQRRERGVGEEEGLFDGAKRIEATVSEEEEFGKE